MSNGPPSNLFDLSAGGSKKKEPKPHHALSKPKQATQIADPEVADLLNKMKQMHGELTQKIEETFEKSGRSKKEIELYCKNPSNFSTEEWHVLNQKNEDLAVRILGKSREEIKKEQVKTLETKGTKERKGKTLGSRKNWLDMR